NETLQLKGAAIALLCATICTILTFAVESVMLSLIFVGIGVLTGYFVNGPMFGTLQTLVPEKMRATSVALVFLVANLIGMGFGPLATGALSDALATSFGIQSLKYALLTISPGYLLAVLLAW